MKATDLSLLLAVCAAVKRLLALVWQIKARLLYSPTKELQFSSAQALLLGVPGEWKGEESPAGHSRDGQ